MLLLLSAVKSTRVSLTAYEVRCFQGRAQCAVINLIVCFTFFSWVALVVHIPSLAGITCLCDRSQNFLLLNCSSLCVNSTWSRRLPEIVQQASESRSLREEGVFRAHTVSHCVIHRWEHSRVCNEAIDGLTGDTVFKSADCNALTVLWNLAHCPSIHKWRMVTMYLTMAHRGFRYSAALQC